MKTTLSRDRIDKHRLWEGCLFGAIASAVAGVIWESSGVYRFWQDDIFVRDERSECDGHIFFENGWKSSQGWMAAVFFNAESEYNPFHYANYSLDTFLDGMPLPQRDIVISNVYDTMSDIKDGVTVPLVTSAFWSNAEDQIEANAPWEQLLREGVEIILEEAKGVTDTSISQWGIELGLPSPLLELAVNLYHRRVADNQSRLELTDSETQLLLEHSTEKPFGSSRLYLAQLNIYCPDTLSNT